MFFGQSILVWIAMVDAMFKPSLIPNASKATRGLSGSFILNCLAVPSGVNITLSGSSVTTGLA